MADATKYIGLSKKAAQNKAEADSFVFRLVSVDGVTYLGYPTDTMTDRVCVELTGGAVSKATIQ